MKGPPPTFRHRLVRDLLWVILSPPIQSGHIGNTYWWDHEKCQIEYQDCLPILIELDKDPSPLEQHLSQLKSKRLGHTFEALVSFWLNISPNYELIQKNVQVIEGGVTFGEIDFIIQEVVSGKIIHLEVCVKFYLGTDPFNDPYHWFGTNTKDQLGRKLDHLLNHQSQLSKKYKNHFALNIDERHCLIKGRLFYPKGNLIAPKGTTNNHLRGSWLYTDTATESKNKYLALNKTRWLAELNHQDITELQDNPVEIFKDRIHCYIEVNRDEDKNYQEIDRVFFLPDKFTFPSDNKNPL